MFNYIAATFRSSKVVQSQRYLLVERIKKAKGFSNLKKNLIIQSLSCDHRQVKRDKTLLFNEFKNNIFWLYYAVMRLLTILFIKSFFEISNNCSNNQCNSIKMGATYYSLPRSIFQMFYVEWTFRAILYNVQVKMIIRLAIVGMFRGKT